MKHILCAITLMILTMTLQASGAWAACSGPSGKAGDIIYNETEHVFQYCNDTDWVGMNKPGSGSGGCTNPTVLEGQMSYNVDHRVLQGCAGNVHVAMGPVGGMHRWLQISAGGNHTCGIQFDKTLWCWGNNGNGQLGDGTTTWRYEMVQIAAGSSWKYIAASFDHTCGIKSDDTLWCWGKNDKGQLGDNSTTQRLSPAQVNGGGSWKQVTAGYSHTCAIKTSDTMWCWGENLYGRTALNISAGNTLVPTQVNGGGSWKQVSAGYFHGCAIKSDDTLKCWGGNGSGQVGDGSTNQRWSPVAVSGATTWKSLGIYLGDVSSCAIKSDDTLWCWGWNGDGQLGDNSTTTRLVPTAVNGGGSWKQVSGSNFNLPASTCGIKSNDTLWCWGGSTYGEVADGTTGTDRLVPTAATGGGTWSQVAAGGNFGCAIKQNGTLACWGYNGSGQLGMKVTQPKTSPVGVNGGSVWTNITTGGTNTGEAFSCGIKSDKSLWCWGSNDYGNLGDGSSTDRSTPTAISGGGSWKDVALGSVSACAIKADDSIWCWGANWYGNLGDGTYNDSSVPVLISGGGSWKQISINGDWGDDTVCAIKSDDTLHCWGYNGDGNMGDGTFVEKEQPTAVSGGGSWKQVSVGNDFTCGLKTDSTLWCWGGNYNGNFGDGTYNDSNIPVLTTGATTWQQISTGYQYMCGVKSDNTLWCWGINDSGRTGLNANSGDTMTPTQISGGGSWKSVAASGHTDWNAQTCGIKSDDTLWCWGYNGSGQLGDGTTTTRLVPVAVIGVGTTGWKTVSTGSNHSCGLLNGGKASCWGAHYSGQLGNGEAYNINSSYYIATALPQMCQNPAAKSGAIAYNSASNILQYCDGNGWVGIVGTGP